MQAVVHDKVVRVECPRAGATLEFPRQGDIGCAAQPVIIPRGLDECCDVCPFRAKARKAALKELDLIFWGAR